MDTLGKIRAEIERLIEINKTKRGFPAGTLCAVRIEAYEKLLSFLDSLSEEPDTDLEDAVSEQSCKAADKHIRKVVDAAGHPGWGWDTQDIADAFIAGAKYKEEQLMKYAVDGKVYHYSALGYVCTDKVQLTERLKQFQDCDKVKVIIVRSDETSLGLKEQG